MGQSHSWEANSHSASQEILGSYWTDVHYLVQKPPPLVPILNQIQSVRPRPLVIYGKKLLAPRPNSKLVLTYIFHWWKSQVAGVKCQYMTASLILTVIIKQERCSEQKQSVFLSNTSFELWKCFLLFATASRPALGPIQPIHWVPRSFHLHLVARLRIRGATPLLPHISSWRGA